MQEDAEKRLNDSLLIANEVYKRRGVSLCKLLKLKPHQSQFKITTPSLRVKVDREQIENFCKANHRACQ